MKIWYVLLAIFLSCQAKFVKSKVTRNLVGTLEAEVQNPVVHSYTLLIFTLLEPKQLDSGSRTSLWLAQDQVLAHRCSAMSLPTTFYNYKRTTTLKWQSAPSIDVVVLTNVHFVPIKLPVRTNPALEQLHRIFSYYISIRNCLVGHSDTVMILSNIELPEKAHNADKMYVTSLFSWTVAGLLNFPGLFSQRDIWSKWIWRFGETGIQFYT